MSMKRSGHLLWRGRQRDGRGTVSTDSCPISKLLNAKITMEARLV
jgi:hypothetical protein